ncbi:MAG: hypothetical protein EBZ49_00560 [Proteobacteria bacterium]|nr:hypothetical protein [Pseudomonadota bacterium]
MQPFKNNVLKLHKNNNNQTMNNLKEGAAFAAGAAIGGALAGVLIVAIKESFSWIYKKAKGV